MNMLLNHTMNVFQVDYLGDGDVSYFQEVGRTLICTLVSIFKN